MTKEVTIWERFGETLFTFHDEGFAGNITFGEFLFAFRDDNLAEKVSFGGILTGILPQPKSGAGPRVVHAQE